MEDRDSVSGRLPADPGGRRPVPAARKKGRIRRTPRVSPQEGPGEPRERCPSVRVGMLQYENKADTEDECDHSQDHHFRLIAHLRPFIRAEGSVPTGDSKSLTPRTASRPSPALQARKSCRTHPTSARARGTWLQSPQVLSSLPAVRLVRPLSRRTRPPPPNQVWLRGWEPPAGTTAGTAESGVRATATTTNSPGRSSRRPARTARR